MISKNDAEAIAKKLYEMLTKASPKVKSLLADTELQQKFANMVEGLSRYKEAFVEQYTAELNSIDPDWQKSKDPSESVRRADAAAQRNMQCSPKMLSLLLKAAHQELRIVFGLRVGHYRVKTSAANGYSPVTDDILEEMMYVGLEECQLKPGKRN